ncbi:MAG: Ig family protein, partial [Betaproteobacteria bacterium]|nr:Ig family protein [Betaproteobacteria bacterium]
LHGSSVAKEVVTFNGAGVGTVDPGYTLQGQLTQFQALQSDPAQIEDAFTNPQVKALYLNIKSHLANGTWTLDQALSAIATLYPVDQEAVKERQWLYRSLTDIKQLKAEAARVPTLTSGGDNPTHPFDVPDSQILAENLTYRLAVEIVSQHTESASLVGGAVRAYGSKVYLTVDQLNRLIAAGTTPATEYEVLGDTTPSMVSNSQYHLGSQDTEIRVPIEDQPLYRGGLVGDVVEGALDFGSIDLLQDGYSQKDFGDTHSLVLLIDSLNTQNALLQLVAPDDRTAAGALLKQVFAQSSYEKRQDGDLISGTDQGQAEGDELENVLNALADFVLGQTNDSRLKGSPDGNTWWRDTEDLDGYTGRDDFYKKLTQIAADAGFSDTLAGKLTLLSSSSELVGDARNNFAAYVALYTLSPFAFKPAKDTVTEDTLEQILSTTWGDVYNAWKTDKDIVAAGGGAVSNVTDEWLQDRWGFLERKLWFNAQNKNPVNPVLSTEDTDLSPFELEPTYYEDIASGYKIAQGLINDATQRFIFGDDQNNTDITGGGVADHLYGNGGNDILSGLAGDDYLEGDDGADTLTGGTDNDTLNGGQGFDTYLFNSGDGSDTIIDSDGQGLIQIDGETLDIGKLIEGSDDLWHSADDKFIFQTTQEEDGSTTLTIFTKNSGDRITLKQFGST